MVTWVYTKVLTIIYWEKEGKQQWKWSRDGRDGVVCVCVCERGKGKQEKKQEAPLWETSSVWET